MALTVAFRGGTRFDIVSQAHTVVTDQSTEDGGADTGMSPVELFVGSLASCVGYFVGRYCARHKIPSEGLTIDAEWSMAEQPHRVGSVKVDVHLPFELTQELKDRLLKVANGCTIHQTLAVPPEVDLSVFVGKGVEPRS